MTFSRVPFVLVVVAWQLLLFAPHAGASTDIKRPVTVADSIEMTLLSPHTYERPEIYFSPDRTHFAVIAHKGNISANSNDYSLLLFDTATVFHSPKPRTLVTFSSTTNEPGIDNLLWTDNSNLMFLATRDDNPTQIYSYSIRTRQLVQHTTSPTDIRAFVFAPRSSTLAYFAAQPAKPVINEYDEKHGFVVGGQWLYELIGNKRLLSVPNPQNVPYNFFVQQPPSAPKAIDLPLGAVAFTDWGFSISPDGQYVLACAKMKDSVAPKTWKQYSEQVAEPLSGSTQFIVINTKNFSSHLLIDAPLAAHHTNSAPQEISWLPTSRSVVLAGLYLPPNADADLDDNKRLSTAFVAEVNLTTHQITPIVEGAFDLLPQPQGDTICLRPYIRHNPDPRPTSCYVKVDDKWQQTTIPSSSDIDVSSTQDANNPPKVVAVDPVTKRKAVVFDPNPQFSHLRLAKVEELSWPVTDDYTMQGGLYLPPDYVPGKPYPLVIQTHGWNPHIFTLDGITSAGYAAQALAAKGILVVQMDDLSRRYFQSTQDGPTIVRAYETLIDYLDKTGHLIDHTHVGLMGWSWTGWEIDYALTHSHFPFAAASNIDGGTNSYMPFLTAANWWGAKDFSSIYGAPPFGDGLKLWLTNAPGFNLDKVKTPLRLVSFSPASILMGDWEMFAGLHFLGKPVDLIYLPDATHDPTKPSERLVAQQGNVDWFCFWLKNEKDPDPNKQDQYARWETLRDQQLRQTSIAKTTD